jgi:hypothetical protein
MRARPEVRAILISHKMRRWSLIAQFPQMYPNQSASRARRNLLKLLARYPDLARNMNLSIASAYPRL